MSGPSRTDRRRQRRVSPSSLAWRLLILLLYAFLLAPVIVGLVISFSSANNLAFPPPGWSLKWYAALLENVEFKEGLIFSLQLAVAAMILAVLFGVAVALAATRGRFPGREMLLNLVTLPLITPAVAIGLGLLLVVAPLGLLGSLPVLLGAHVLLTTPFVTRIVAAGISATPPDYEEAAGSLGASPAVRFRRVLLPIILPSIIASAAMSFIISMGETAITLFIIADKATLPVVMFRFVTGRTDPQLAALSVVFMGFTLVAVMVAQSTIGGLGRLAHVAGK